LTQHNVHVRMHSVRAHTLTHTTHTHIHACMHTHTYKHTQRRTDPPTHPHTHTSTCIFVHLCTGCGPGISSLPQGHREAGVLSRRLVVEVGDARRRLDFASLVCTRLRVSNCKYSPSSSLQVQPFLLLFSRPGLCCHKKWIFVRKVSDESTTTAPRAPGARRLPAAAAPSRSSGSP